MNGAENTTVPAANREPTPEVCAHIKIHAYDGTYLGTVTSDKANQVAKCGLGRWVKNYIQLFPDSWRGSTRVSGLHLTGLKPHNRESRNNPRGVWTFRGGKGGSK